MSPDADLQSAEPVAWRYTLGATTYCYPERRHDVQGWTEEPLYPESALLAERQAREAAERERDAARAQLSDPETVTITADRYRKYQEAEARAEAAEASLAKANATIERLTTEGLYISEQFSGAAGDIVKLRARIAELEGVILKVADQCDQWAKESRSGGWSTHQVKANITLANELRHSVLSSINKEPSHG